MDFGQKSQVKVSPQMIFAGVRVLKESYLALADSDDDGYPLIARTVYEAM